MRWLRLVNTYFKKSNEHDVQFYSKRRFGNADGNLTWTVFPFNLSDATYLSSIREKVKNLGDTAVLACEMFASGCRPFLKNVACLSSLLLVDRGKVIVLHVRYAFYHIFCITIPWKSPRKQFVEKTEIKAHHVLVPR